MFMFIRKKYIFFFNSFFKLKKKFDSFLFNNFKHISLIELTANSLFNMEIEKYVYTFYFHIGTRKILFKIKKCVNEIFSFLCKKLCHVDRLIL